MPADSLLINEIFFSIQGESTWVGLPCVFVRLSACNLRCRYCDTEYAFYEGNRMDLTEILAKVESYGCSLVEITGGEPLLQRGVHHLMSELCDRGKTVLLETSGSRDIAAVDPRVTIILDLKTPASGEAGANLWENLPHLKPQDEIKFVLMDRDDYLWAKAMVEERGLNQRHTVLFSPVFGDLSPEQLAGWILEDRLNVRFQLQLHKLIWDPAARGV